MMLRDLCCLAPGLLAALLAASLHIPEIAAFLPALAVQAETHKIALALNLVSAGAIIAGVMSIMQSHQQWRDDNDRAGLLEATANGLILFDRHNYFKSCNRAAYDLLPEYFACRAFRKDLSLPDFLGLLHDNGLSLDHDLSEALHHKPSPHNKQDFQDFIRNRDNKYLHVQIRPTPLGETGLIISDITDIKVTNDELQRMYRRNKELLAAIDAASSGIVIANPDAPGEPIVYANQALCNMYGLSRQVLEGLSITALFEELESQEGLDALATIDADGEDKTFEITIHDDNDGRQIQSFIHELNLVQSRQGARRLIGIQTDQTRLKSLEAKMAQSQKLEALGNLAGGVAHDFNNVLSIIDGYAYLAERHIDAPETLHPKLDSIRSAVRRGSDLTGRLLAFGRHSVKTREIVDIASFIGEQKVLLHPLVGAGITLEKQLGEFDNTQSRQNAAYVECVPDEMAQILINLVVNARDAIGEHGHITIALGSPDPGRLHHLIDTTSTVADYLVLSVHDNGQGMDAATYQRVFEPFFTTKEEGQGTGLGLSMIYGFVTDMNGVIDIETAPGEGTSFHIYLPRSVQPNNIADDKTTGMDNEQLRWPGATVLVAEDEPELLDLVTGMLEQFELTVITAVDGNDALAVQEDYDGQIDLLLTDILMPGLNGVHMAELFTALRPETQIIYMSGYPGRDKIADIQLPEQAILLAKPVRMETLSRLLYNFFSGADEATIRAGLSNTGQWMLNDNQGKNQGLSQTEGGI
jgi:PAS domain S-box-containing protein